MAHRSRVVASAHSYVDLKLSWRVDRQQRVYTRAVDRYIAVGYVPTALAAVGTEIEVEVRGRGQRARVAKTPFHSPRVKK